MSSMMTDRMTGMMGGMNTGMNMMPMMGGMGMMPGMMNGVGMNTMPMGGTGMMMPRCTMKMEKMQGGMRCTMTCDDKTMAMMMQNLCNMMAGGMCSMCCMMNGMPVCCSMMM